MITDALLSARLAFAETTGGILESYVEPLRELQWWRAMEKRLEEWAVQLEANRDQPGDVGSFIAAELRYRMRGAK